MSDFNLERFVEAQDAVIDQVRAELRSGRKETHWMWFVFPQIEGLGQSSMARKYAISSRDEAAAYLAHPILGQRLRECAQLVNAIEGRSIDEIFGYPDNLKFRSSMTLFANVAAGNEVFQHALDKYFGGQADSRTVELLARKM